MKKTLAIATLVIAICSAYTSAQTASCPKIETHGPSASVVAGDAVTFVANVSGGDLKAVIKYDWSVSIGKITKGQGSPAIVVDSSAAGDQTITATVEIGGVDERCSRTSSVSADIKAAVKPILVEQYSSLRPQDEATKLDSAMNALMNRPGSILYIIVYPGKKDMPGDLAADLRRLKNQFVEFRGMDPDRITTMAGGQKAVPTIELWLAPNETLKPEPSPPAGQKKKP